MRTVLFLLLLTTTLSLDFTIFERQTCFEYMVQEANTPKVFSFHCDQNREQVELIIYGPNRNVLAGSSKGTAYNSYIEVTYPDTGNFSFCFQKDSTNTIDVSLDIIEQIDDQSYAGKEDINKVCRRISAFLVDIRKTGFQMKQTLSEHIKVKQKLKDISWASFNLTIIKSAIMCIILAVQVYVVKKVYS